mgnify:FL=1
MSLDSLVVLALFKSICSIKLPIGVWGDYRVLSISRHVVKSSVGCSFMLTIFVHDYNQATYYTCSDCRFTRALCGVPLSVDWVIYTCCQPLFYCWFVFKDSITFFSQHHLTWQIAKQILFHLICCFRLANYVLSTRTSSHCFSRRNKVHGIRYANKNV